MKLTEQDFLEHLNEQIYFLQISSENFDKGIFIEAKRLAVVIRTLLHDTTSSTSLLTHLKVKQKLYYFNTAIPESKFGLTGIRTTTEGGGRTEYYPPLNNLSEKRKQRPWVTFSTWWSEMIVLDDGRNKFSRKDLVLSVSNKDGGAHVDKKLNGSYSDLSRGNSMNLFHENIDGSQKSITGIELASIRQITFELLETLQKRSS
ncbi:hypothetical protein [Bacillus sp. MMSF_3328]|uniref:hypothetical protein n=1 Tax=Bacillus sp. MMSF_3328 TaxID=3047080 RepID=UPI00273EEAA9|nr:hypothetical protein [Bacillus sp. MMSF_3328]